MRTMKTQIATNSQTIMISFSSIVFEMKIKDSNNELNCKFFKSYTFVISKD